MNAWVQAIIWRYQAGLLTDPATACAEELVCVYNNLHHGNYSGVDDLLDGMSFRNRAQYILDLGKQAYGAIVPSMSTPIPAPAPAPIRPRMCRPL